MNKDTSERFRNLLVGLPGWGDSRSRRAFVEDALWGHPVLDELDLGGAPGDVASDVVRYCERSDSPTEEGLHPFCALLQAVRGRVGSGGRRDPVIAELKQALCRSQSHDKVLPSTRSVLLLAADPSDQARLSLGTEFREIEEKLRLAKLRDRFVLRQRMAVRPADLAQGLLDEQPELVHFSGHGSGEGGLFLEDEQGHGKLVSGQALSTLFKEFADQVKVVLLNACLTEPQAEAIAEHIDFVVGTRQAIGDEAAIAFSVGFYQALGAGRSVEEAFRLGCAQIQLQGMDDHLVPVLLRKNGERTTCT